MAKKFEELKQELQKVIGKSNLPKDQKKELGQKIKNATSEEQITKIMKGVELESKEKPVGTSPSKVIENTVNNGVRVGVNDVVAPVEVNPETKQTKKIKTVKAIDSCPLCTNAVVDGKCINCEFDSRKGPKAKIKSVLSTKHKSTHPPKIA